MGLIIRGDGVCTDDDVISDESKEEEEKNREWNKWLYNQIQFQGWTFKRRVGHNDNNSGWQHPGIYSLA